MNIFVIVITLATVFFLIVDDIFIASKRVFLKASSRAQMPTSLAHIPRALAFTYSAFEFSRVLSKEPLRWSIDQWAPGEQDNPHFRMGGWNVITLIIVLGLIIYSSKESPKITLAFFGLVLLTAFLPQSHELRYWFYVPLIGILTAASSFKINAIKNKNLLLTFMACNFIWVSSAVSRRLDPKDPHEYGPDRIADFISKPPTTQTYKVCDMPYDILYTGKKATEFKIESCY